MSSLISLYFKDIYSISTCSVFRSTQRVMMKFMFNAFVLKYIYLQKIRLLKQDWQNKLNQNSWNIESAIVILKNYTFKLIYFFPFALCLCRKLSYRILLVRSDCYFNTTKKFVYYVLSKTVLCLSCQITCVFCVTWLSNDIINFNYFEEITSWTFICVGYRINILSFVNYSLQWIKIK